MNLELKIKEHLLAINRLELGELKERVGNFVFDNRGRKRFELVKKS
jgi:hypothetical protein